jgi:cytidylate kinase
MIVTIDGPAGSGKSSAARALAQRLGFQYLDTGAMYRAVTVAAMRQHCNWDDPAAVEALLSSLHIELPPGKVLLNGEDVTVSIRTPAVTEASRKAANNQTVRQKLVELQREAAAGRDMVCEGRDQGTIVFPDAPCKFFLIADDSERARRRHQELREQGEEVSLEEVLESQRARDQRDARRDIAPMVPANDAMIIDTSAMSLDQVVDFMEQAVHRCQHG